MFEPETIEEKVKSYFVCNSKAIGNLEQGLSETYTIVCVVHLYKAKERTLQLPALWRVFYPMTGDSKITVSITCLPSITSQVNITLDDIALRNSIVSHCRFGW